MNNTNSAHSLPGQIDSIVIGGSQSGLSVSYWLTQAGCSHIVLEKDVIGSSWIHKRWDSFCLVTPNWMIQLPGFAYQDDDPDGFILRDDIVRYLERYAESFNPPIHQGIEVTGLSREGDGFVVNTTRGTVRSSSVFVCVGYFHEGRFPDCAQNLDSSINQLHSRDYKNPDQLQEGGVLVVGSGQSGAQLAEEMHDANRETWLSVSSAVREPRQYRGKDTNYWYDLMGGFDKSFADINDPRERYTPNPHCSGKNGGHALNLEKFSQDGIRLVGRVKDINGTVVDFQDNLIENVRNADRASVQYMMEIDKLIEERQIDAPAVSDVNTDDGTPDIMPDIKEVPALDLKQQGITNIVWATGFQSNYDWIEFPVLNERGYPDQRRGVTQIPGLYFCGLHWMHCLKSGLFFGVGEDANHVVNHMLNDRLE
jgi:putative flavoprotein involved in K+ transport